MKIPKFLFAPVLCVAVFACGDGLSPADPLADDSLTGLTISAVSPLKYTVIAGNAVTNGPQVIVRDRFGIPRKGVRVTFGILNGTGRVLRVFDSTNADGIATPIAWSPSTTAGQVNQMIASIDQQRTVVFTATVVPADPAFLVKIDGDNQIAAGGAVTGRQPRVRVSDIFSNLIVGENVEFEVIEGNGSIQRTTAVTDAEGAASAGAWTLGVQGKQILRAAIANLTTNFEAIALAPGSACDRVIQLQSQSTVSADVNSQGCVTSDDRRVAFYYLTVPTNSAVVFTARTDGFDGSVELRTDNGLLVGRRDIRSESAAARMPAVLLAGTYKLAIIAGNAGAAGTYTVTFGSLNLSESVCDGVYVIQGTSISSPALAPHCRTAPQADIYRIHLAAGSEVRVGLFDRSYSDWNVQLQSLDGQLLATSTSSTYYHYDLQHVVKAEGDYLIKVYNLFEDGDMYDIEFH